VARYKDKSFQHCMRIHGALFPVERLPSAVKKMSRLGHCHAAAALISPYFFFHLYA